MATKPSAPASWDVNDTNSIPPTSGHINDGYADDEIPNADEFNGQLNLIGQWTEYLNDGDFSGDMSFDGAIGYTGTTALNLSATVNNADPQGDGTTDGLRVLEVTPTAANTWILKGLVGGVDGREITIVNVDFSAYRHFHLGHECAAATAANRFVLPAAITVDAEDTIRVYPGGSVTVRYNGTLSRWIVISTSGCRIKKIVSVSPAAALAVDLVNAVYSIGQFTMTGTVTLNYPVNVPYGSIIEGYRLHYDKNSNTFGAGGATLASQLYAGNSPSSPSDSDDTNASGNLYFEEMALETVVGLGNGGFQIVASRTGSGTSDVFYNALVYYWDII